MAGKPATLEKTKEPGIVRRIGPLGFGKIRTPKSRREVEFAGGFAPIL